MNALYQSVQACHRNQYRRILVGVLVLIVFLLTACGGGGDTDNPPVQQDAAITTQPTNQSVEVGNSAIFDVVATDAIAYQWQSSSDSGATFSDVNNATSDNYVTPATQLTDDGTQYRVVVSGEQNSVISTIVILTVTDNSVNPPADAVISTQPVSQSVEEGNSATFDVIASNATAYQWQKSTDGGSTFSNVNGASSASYTTPVTLLTDNATRYRVLVSGVNNSVTSSVVTLTVSAATQQSTLPPDPVTIAPVIDATIATNLATATSFLYTGVNPVQTGVSAGTIKEQRVAVLRGKVLNRDNSPLSGVKISVLNHPEFGQTLSRVDGMFDLAVNGGGQLTIQYQKDGFIASQRPIEAPWRDYAWLPDVVIVAYDTAVTTIDLGVSTMQVARSSVVTDSDGSRQATVLFPVGTTVSMVLPNGSTQPLTTINIRATEFTVGENGLQAMPGPLPPSSGYTYAVELSVDEAIAAGATQVNFNQAIPFYVENLIDLPVGSAVPSGYYDLKKGQWVAVQNGRVIKVVSITNGRADLDTDGDDTIDDANTLALLNIGDEERSRLSHLYTAGQTLWRAPLTHFTPVDLNLPAGPPSDAIAPPGAQKKNPVIDTPNEECGSIIDCETQSLGESIPLVGLGTRLHYKSGRNPELYNTLQIPVSGPGVLPSSLQSMRAEVTIAGRLYYSVISPAPDQVFVVTWDGKDAYGRTLLGSQVANVKVSYDYKPQTYSARADYDASFARATAAGAAVTGGRTSGVITLTKVWKENIGSWDSRAFGLGGWSLDIQHAYDPLSHTLLFGNGQQRRGAALPSIITTVVGGDTLGNSIFDVPVAQASIRYPSAVATGPDGSIYFADMGNNRIRRITPEGILTTFAGSGGAATFGGDGGPATSAYLKSPQGVAVGPDGSVYIGDSGNARVRRVRPDGIINTVAGNGTFGYSGDNGPATDAQLYEAQRIAVGADGSLFIAGSSNHQRVRCVGPDGLITTVAGNGSQGFSGDGGPATDAMLDDPAGVAVGADGSLYIADRGNNRIRRVSPDGIISTVAGHANQYNDSNGDGGLATEATLNGPQSIAVGLDDSLYIADSNNFRVRRVDSEGIITRVAGMDGYSNGGFAGDGGPATAESVELQQVADVAVGADGTLYLADLSNNRIRAVHPVLPDYALSDVLLSSEDGHELYLFNSNGRHLKTLDALTGAIRYQFGYDENGYLTSVSDGSGNITNIERYGSIASAIVAPGGQRTVLNVSSDGWLLSVMNPAGEAFAMDYTVDGLLKTFTEPGANVHHFTYNYDRRLIKDENPAGGSTSLARTGLENGYAVTTTTELGATHIYQVEQLPTGAVLRTTTAPGGARTVTQINPDSSEQTTYADGTIITTTYDPDPRWGMLAPRVSKRLRKAPDGKTETVTTHRVVSLDTDTDPLSLRTLNDTLTVNGRTFTTYFDAPTRTMTERSAEGREIVSQFDEQGRVFSQSLASGVDPVTVTFNNKGLVSMKSQGSQSWTYSYDTRNRLIARSDATGRAIGFLYDNADRVIEKTLPSGETYQFSYDANGNVTEIVLPSGARHTLGYTPLNLYASYTPPGNASYVRTLNVDRQLTKLTLPGGRITSQGYDNLGRVSSLSFQEATTGFEYLTDDLTDRVAKITSTPVDGADQDIAYSYNGNLIASMSATGIAPSTVSYSYDNNFFTTAMNLVSGTDTLQNNLLRDNDGLIRAFGPFTFTRGGPGGAMSQLSDSNASTDYGYDSLGRIDTRSHTVSSVNTYTMDLTHDNSGRILTRTETIDGVSNTDAYSYDLNGQLIEVKRDGVVSEHYAYDVNGNRTLREIGSNPAELATYDAQDRLLTRGTVDYTFDSEGFLTQRGSDIFQYNSRAQLIKATIAGQVISYDYDGLGRRVSRTSGGDTYQYLYGDPASQLITAVRDPQGELTQLYYDTAGLLVALERGGVRYYVATDQVGTPKVVADSDGNVIKKLAFDSFGDLITDSNPAFDLPLGFAGGLLDSSTGLVHFGLRDYDPAAARWTTRDPVLFEGRQGNLYAYVSNNPVNFRDPSGLFCISVSVYEGIGGGVQTCITSEGASVCAEVGFGVGVNVGVDAGGDLDKTGTALVAEAAYTIGGAGKIGVGLSLDSGGCFSASPKGQLGPITFEPGKGGLDLDLVEAAPKIGAGAEAKIAGKGCVQGKF